MDRRSPHARRSKRSLLHLWLVALALCAFATELSAATFSLAPMSLSFPQQTVGVQSGPQIVTLSNKNKTALQVTTTITPTTDFTFTTNCAATIPANGTCTISVFFTPTAPGTRTATLTVTDSSKASNKDSVKLSGLG